VPATALLCALSGRMRQALTLFDRTGGLHAAGLFDATGRLVCLREDVGRHNAFDKVIGWAAMGGLRAAAEAPDPGLRPGQFRAGPEGAHGRRPIPRRGVGPSNLAAELAEEAGMTLVGFLRGDTMNVYAGAERVI